MPFFRYLIYLIAFSLKNLLPIKFELKLYLKINKKENFIENIMAEKDLDKVDDLHPLKFGGLVRLLELEDQSYNKTTGDDYIVPLVTLYCVRFSFLFDNL